MTCKLNGLRYILDYFLPLLVVKQVEMKALDELVAQKLPRLHAHFTAIDLDMSMLATDWYLGLYCTSFPTEVRHEETHTFMAMNACVLYALCFTLC